jgi:fructokinase
MSPMIAESRRVFRRRHLMISPHETRPGSGDTLRLGIDLGGTKIEGIALVGSREIARRRLATPRGDYDATLEAIAALVGDLETRAGRTGTIGLGIPGTPSPLTGLVKNANSVWLIGRPLQADLEARLGRQVRIANDANCFAVSEAIDGAAAGADVVFGVILGTGTGAGVVVRRQILTGPNAVAGEWGHNPLPWPDDEAEAPGLRCYCGRRGCLETFLSGPGLTAEYARVTGRSISPERIVGAFEAGQAEAAAVLDTYARRLAKGLATVINVLDPEVIVLGGGLSNIDWLYGRVPQLWGDFVFGATSGHGAVTGADGPAAGFDGGYLRDVPASPPREPVWTRLVRAAHGDASGVRGAAWLW